MLEKLGIEENLEKLSKEVEQEIESQLKKIDEICEKNSMKVLSAFQECTRNAFKFINGIWNRRIRKK